MYPHVQSEFVSGCECTVTCITHILVCVDDLVYPEALAGGTDFTTSAASVITALHLDGLNAYNFLFHQLNIFGCCCNQ